MYFPGPLQKKIRHEALNSWLEINHLHRLILDRSSINVSRRTRRGGNGVCNIMIISQKSTQTNIYFNINIIYFVVLKNKKADCSI